MEGVLLSDFLDMIIWIMDDINLFIFAFLYVSSFSMCAAEVSTVFSIF